MIPIPPHRNPPTVTVTDEDGFPAHMYDPRRKEASVDVGNVRYCDYNQRAWSHPLVSLMVLAGILCCVPDGIRLSVEFLRVHFTLGLIVGVLSVVAGLLGAEALQQPKVKYVAALGVLCCIIVLISVVLLLSSLPSIGIIKLCSVRNEVKGKPLLFYQADLAESRLFITSLWLMLSSAMELVVAGTLGWLCLRSLKAGTVPAAVVIA